jgi:hypothetical protein
MSPEKRIALTVTIALRRDKATLDYYRAGPFALPLAACAYYVRRRFPPHPPDP